MVHRERRMSRGFQGIGNALQLDVEKPQNKGAHTLVNAASLTRSEEGVGEHSIA